MFQCMNSAFNWMPPCCDNLVDKFCRTCVLIIPFDTRKNRFCRPLGKICVVLSVIFNLKFVVQVKWNIFKAQYVSQNSNKSLRKLCAHLHMASNYWVSQLRAHIMVFHHMIFFYFWCSDHPVISGYRWNYKLLPLPQMVRFSGWQLPAPLELT